MDFYKCKTMNRDECRNNAQTIKKIRTCILVVGRSEIVFIFRVLNFLVYDSDWYPSVFSIKYTLGEIWLSAISIKNAFCISSSICLRTLHTNYDKILCCVKKWMFVFIYFTHKKYLKNNKILLRHFGLPFWTNCTTILLGQAYFFWTYYTQIMTKTMFDQIVIVYRYYFIHQRYFQRELVIFTKG